MRTVAISGLCLLSLSAALAGCGTPVSSASDDHLVTERAELEAQHEQGLITDQEYQDRRKELAKVAAKYDGIYASHIRNEGDRLLEAIDEAIEIGERSGAPVLIHHLKASGRANWGRMDEAVARIEAARGRGLDVMASVYPYTASSTGLDAVLPAWFEAETPAATITRLHDPAWRDSLSGYLDGRHQGGDWNLATSAGGPEGVLISDVVTDSLERYEGMRLSEIAAEEKRCQ